MNPREPKAGFSMRQLIAHSFLFSLALSASGSLPGAAVDFSHEIVPVLREHCAECHAGEKKKGGFSFNTRETLLQGSENGEVVKPGKSAESRMIEVVLSTDKDEQMPPKGARLPAEKIALLKRWIDEGAPWEAGFAFKKAGYEPPLKPRKPELPAATSGREHPIDRIVDAYQARLKVPMPKSADDGTFLRRASLDITGLLPSPERRESFLADKAPDKRARLIRELLADKQAYAEHWLVFWNDMLRNDYAGTGYIDGGRKQITGWLYMSLIENKPYDQFVRELIAPGPEAEGFINGIKWRGNVNASQVREIQFAQNLGQVFLGINLKCASCHDSFIDRWKLEEAYSLAAIYATTPLEVHRCDVAQGRKATPGWLFPEIGNVKPDAPQPERLKQLAALVTSAENGRFTRTIANRLWHRLMGHGIAHPVDAMGTEPWSEDLLDHLGTFVLDNGYDLKKVIEHIATSEAYQAVSASGDEPAASDVYVFRGPVPRRMTAEQFMDATWQITGTAPPKPDANVLRGEAKAAAKRPEGSLRATWIWKDAEFRKAGAGQQVTFRRVFTVPQKFSAALMGITCDNEYRVIVNGKEAAADTDLTRAEVIPLGTRLKAGANNLMIVARNGGGGPNPAALIAELRVSAGAESVVIGTGADWEWSDKAPDARGKMPDGTAWAKAVEIEGAPVYGRLAQHVQDALEGAPTGDGGVVRASLVRSNLLMRTLGRPNREQVVTERPAIFTTLEAIDLANGQLLTDLLARGAAGLAARFKGDTNAFATWLFRQALSRDMNARETEALGPLLEGTLDEARTADILWAVLMLPDFQLVR